MVTVQILAVYGIVFKSMLLCFTELVWCIKSNYTFNPGLAENPPPDVQTASWKEGCTRFQPCGLAFPVCSCVHAWVGSGGNGPVRLYLIFPSWILALDSGCRAMRSSPMVTESECVWGAGSTGGRETPQIRHTQEDIGVHRHRQTQYRISTYSLQASM